MPGIVLLFQADDSRIQTQIGLRRSGEIVIGNSPAGYGLFGPHIGLPRGRYRARIRFAEGGEVDGRVVMEISSNIGSRIVVSSPFDLASLAPCKRFIELEFLFENTTPYCEVRLHCEANTSATVTGIEIEFLDLDHAMLESLLAGDYGYTALTKRLDRLERLSHGGAVTYVGNNRVLTRIVIDNHILAFLMPADDRLIVPGTIVSGQYEPELTRYFLQTILPTDHCLDVGANYGYYTCVMAARAPRGKVIGIEPDETIYELLRDNIHINNFGAFTTGLHAAAADVVGRLTLHRRLTRSGNTSIIDCSPEYAAALGETSPTAFDVSCTTIDDLLPRFEGRIDFIKIDVEGAEPLAFRGAKLTLETNPQVKVVMEWSPAQIHGAGFDVGEFVTELAALGFDAALIGAGGPQPIALTDLDYGTYHSGILLTLRQ